MKRFLHRITSPGTLIFASAVFVSIGVGIVIYSSRRSNLRASLIAISITIAAAGYLFNARIALHSQLRDRAFNFLLESRDSSDLSKSLKKVSLYFRRYNPTRQEIARLYASNSEKEEDLELHDSITTVGNFFEEMAVAIYFKEINEYLIKEYYRGSFLKFFEDIEPFLETIRGHTAEGKQILGNRNRDYVFEKLEWLYHRWS